MRFLPIAALLIPAIAAAAPTPTDALTDLRPFVERVHVARVGASGLTADQLVDDQADREVELWAEQIVVARHKDAVRIVVDDDDARLLLWIATADLAWTVARPTRIVGRGATGVWILPGAPLAITGAGRRVAASYTSASFTVHGTLPRRALAHVFRATAEPAHPGTLTTAAILREPAGAPLLQNDDGLEVTVVDRGTGEWRLVEHRGRYVRVVGWIRGRELREESTAFGSGVGGGYGMSDTQRIVVPAGACLFDPVSGALVGIQTATSQRFASDERGGSWWVYVGNAWGLRHVIVRDLARGAGDPRWQMCT